MWRLFLILFVGLEPMQSATRLKELVAIQGVRDNQLVGYGIVVGLAGSGDKRQTVFSAQSLANLLQRLGASVSPQAIQVRNTASVLVTATLPPFAQPGTHIDITVSAIGDAPNLQGGQLVLTPLKAADGQVYAVAQGAVVTGGFIAGRGGNSQSTNHPTSGRIPNGAIVERGAPSVQPTTVVHLQLRQADFTNAARISEVINKHYGTGKIKLAQAESASLIRVAVPDAYRERSVEFVAELESLSVDADHVVKIVINEKTGTITMGKEIHIAPVSILHGKLTVEIRSSPLVSQPEPMSQGKTATAVTTEVSAKEEKAKSLQLQSGASVDDLVRGLLLTGCTPRDVVSILQNLKAAGALDAELEVI